MGASADFIEPADGELSGNYLSPTPVALTPNGVTRVAGNVQGAGMGRSIDLDYFRVTVPTGQVLSAINVLPGTIGAGAIGTFIAVFDGPAVNPDTAVSTDLLGYYLYRTADIGTNILDDIATFNFQGTNPADGFVPPLPADDYIFWIQEGFNGIFPYNLQFVLRGVPEPGTLALAGLALAGLAFKRRKK